ncbi:S1 family peptidase [Wenjunlia tyrosinilytica]|uniref:Serine protease n=1 Tax=Wenjunlia tyrosinilytica TaxID=1544741 RepID=A0A917ZUE3_9ACTN|nr:serine protease [Wenjunlia tyrosinilytica]GGO93545.1 hypothetical protein GCM10012280_46300 [Wenjunlia tyrosinilytica]
MAVRHDRASEALVRICDLAGRPRGTGFLADTIGTVITSHEAVDGLARLVLHGPAPGESRIIDASAVVPLPDFDIALVRTEGIPASPLPIAAAGGARHIVLGADPDAEALILGTATVTYTATDRFHLIADVMEFTAEVPGGIRLNPELSGSPVIDRDTGAVLAVLGTALHAGPDSRPDGGFAVPLRQVTARAMARLLARNEATVPAYGPDLNLAGALQLAATTVGLQPVVERSERADIEEELDHFLDPAVTDTPDRTANDTANHTARDTTKRTTKHTTNHHTKDTANDVPTPDDTPTATGVLVLGLVGDPGCGRTTELAALTIRRAQGQNPAPTVWLRGADLHPDDHGLKDAVERALSAAGRIVAATSCVPLPPEGACPDAVGRLAEAGGRPLLVVLDGPEEMPTPALGLTDWTSGTADWLRTSGVRLAIACRPEYWEHAGALFPAPMLYRPRNGGPPSSWLPACVRVGALSATQAERVRTRLGVPAHALTRHNEAHPLALRLLADLRQAVPDLPKDATPSRGELFTAHLDLAALRIAFRLSAESTASPSPTPLRMLALKVTGRVHEAARRCLGPGQGGLDAESFEELFPWRTGWACAVLTERLLTPAGSGYRFTHEELADWLQGLHLDVDEALDTLALAEPPAPPSPDPLPPKPSRFRRGRKAPPPPETRPAPPTAPVPRHRAGPVVQALLTLDETQGPTALTPRLERLAQALDGDGTCPEESAWWAAHLLAGTLLKLPHAERYLDVLHLLARQITVHSVRIGGFQNAPRLRRFEPRFWMALPLPLPERVELLRLLLPADAPPSEAGEDRFLDAAGRYLADDPGAVQPLLCEWFDDERRLQAAATVAAATQALLHTHRRRAVDDLTEALVAAAHPRADELLAALAEDEPSAVCRAVDRWSHDERLERHVAAGAYGLRAAPHITTDADRRLLRYAAQILLGRSTDCSVHGAALSLLVLDPATRSRHLPQALAAFEAADPNLCASALGAALSTHPEEVLAAFQARLEKPGAAVADVLRELADVRTPALSRRAAELVRDYLDLRPEGAVHVAAYLDRRLEQGPEARAVLLPLVTGLVRDQPPAVRRCLASVLVTPGGRASRPLRQELLDVLLEHERNVDVLDAVLQGAAEHVQGRPAALTRELVLRAALLLGRTPEGTAHLDRRLGRLATVSPAFARGTWETLSRSAEAPAGVG